MGPPIWPGPAICARQSAEPIASSSDADTRNWRWNRMIQLGVIGNSVSICYLVARGGIEPPTLRFSGLEGLRSHRAYFIVHFPPPESGRLHLLLRQRRRALAWFVLRHPIRAHRINVDVWCEFDTNAANRTSIGYRRPLQRREFPLLAGQRRWARLGPLVGFPRFPGHLL